MSSSMYRTIQPDMFPDTVEISFGGGESRRTLHYEKVTWDIDGARLGLRYGENPDQPASMYKLVNGNLEIGGVTSVEPGRYLMSDAELLQSGKHPGKINITDVDSALGIMRYLPEKPCAVVVKHNNPAGVCVDDSIAAAYRRAFMADRIAAFGGVVVCNRSIDRETAVQIAGGYTEVVAAPDYDDGCVEILKHRKNLRIMRIPRLDRISEFAPARAIEYKSLVDGGLILQWSFVPKQHIEDFVAAEAKRDGQLISVRREPTAAEKSDMMFGWLVESGVTSNSVLYVKDGVTIGIGSGEPDRVGVAEIARIKARRNASERLCFEEFGVSILEASDEQRGVIEKGVDEHPPLRGCVMISDAFFPRRDGVEIGLRGGVAAVLQPGGAIRDAEVIDACNEYDAAMLFTNQRSFRH